MRNQDKDGTSLLVKTIEQEIRRGESPSPASPPMRRKDGLSPLALNLEKKLLMEKVAAMTNLPTPGAKMFELMVVLRNDDIEMSALVDIIAKDVSLVTQIMKLINSGYYGLRKTIDTVDRAVNLLGIIKIKQVVYAASIMDMFTNDEKEEWNHAYTSSMLMADFMERERIMATSSLSMMMLMHDVGKLVLRRFAPKKYEFAKAKSENERIPICQAEEAVLKIDHAEIGGWLLERWKMTREIHVPIAQHHLPPEKLPDEFFTETVLVKIVDWIDSAARDMIAPPPPDELFERVGLADIDRARWVETQRELIRTLEQKPEEAPGAGGPAGDTGPHAAKTAIDAGQAAKADFKLPFSKARRGEAVNIKLPPTPVKKKKNGLMAAMLEIFNMLFK